MAGRENYKQTKLEWILRNPPAIFQYEIIDIFTSYFYAKYIKYLPIQNTDNLCIIELEQKINTFNLCFEISFLMTHNIL